MPTGPGSPLRREHTVVTVWGKMPKDLRPFVVAARAAGWRERKTKQGLLFYPPNGSRPISVHLCGRSSGHVRENARRKFRANGLDV